jgi:hypothetical protein
VFDFPLFFVDAIAFVPFALPSLSLVWVFVCGVFLPCSLRRVCFVRIVKEKKLKKEKRKTANDTTTTTTTTKMPLRKSL